MQLVRSPDRWKVGVSSFFINGEPIAAELANQSAAYSSAAISTMMVQVPEFRHIQISGNFHVQIFGTDGPNSVYVYGPNAFTRNVTVDTRNGILCVRQAGPVNPGAMRSVIVRIGVRRLDSIKQMGSGSIEAVNIRSRLLNIYSGAGLTGNIFIEGPGLCIGRIVKMGCGSVTVFGVQSPDLQIIAGGSGAVNVCGNVGIRSIIHRGTGDVNILGANSNNLCIDASGAGKISVNGIVRLERLTAKGNVCVLICTVIGDLLRVFVGDHALVGLSGKVRTLYLNTAGMGRFAGRSLCTWESFVKTRASSHVNVSASDKLFAYAIEDSSIYTFGPADALSQHTTDSALIFSFYQYRSCITPPFQIDRRIVPRLGRYSPIPSMTMAMRPGEG